MSHITPNCFVATYYLFRVITLVMVVGVTCHQTSKQITTIAEKNAILAPAVCVGPQVQKGNIKAAIDTTKQSIKELRQITAQLKLGDDLESEQSVYYNPKALGSSLPKGNMIFK